MFLLSVLSMNVPFFLKRVAKVRTFFDFANFAAKKVHIFLKYFSLGL